MRNESKNEILNGSEFCLNSKDNNKKNGKDLKLNIYHVTLTTKLYSNIFDTLYQGSKTFLSSRKCCKKL